MSQEISERDIFQLTELIRTHIGLHYPKNRWRDLMRNMDPVSKQLGFTDVNSCIFSLLSEPLTKREIDVLIKHLTIGETFFFRDNCVFQALKDTILPELIRTRSQSGKRMAFWSAACCTGEEPYSIAILIDQMIPTWEEWNIRVVATDLNEEFLKKAGHGIYTNWSFRNVPQWIKKRYFTCCGDNSFELSPRVRKMVRFSQLNLVTKDFLQAFSGMDVIFCRNVLMYFSEELREQIIDHFMQVLTEGGWLVLSPSEVPLMRHPGLTPVQFPGAILFRKETLEKKKGPSIFTSQAKTVDQEKKFSISPVAVACKTPSDHSLKSELKDVLTSQVSDFINEEKSKEKGTNQEAETQKNLLQEALALYAEGAYDRVAQKLNEVLSRTQNTADSLSLNPGSMALMARAYANQGKLDEAKKWCMQAIDAEKLLPGHYYLHATICQEQGLLEESINSLKKALYLDQDFILAHFALGNLTQKIGRFDESQRHLKNALSLLSSLHPEAVLPYSEGIQAGRLLEVVQSMIKEEKSQ